MSSPFVRWLLSENNEASKPAGVRCRLAMGQSIGPLDARRPAMWIQQAVDADQNCPLHVGGGVGTVQRAGVLCNRQMQAIDHHGARKSKTNTRPTTRDSKRRAVDGAFEARSDEPAPQAANSGASPIRLCCSSSCPSSKVASC